MNNLQVPHSSGCEPLIADFLQSHRITFVIVGSGIIGFQTILIAIASLNIWLKELVKNFYSDFYLNIENCQKIL